jgi:hypothetical protein
MGTFLLHCLSSKGPKHNSQRSLSEGFHQDVPHAALGDFAVCPKIWKIRARDMNCTIDRGACFGPGREVVGKKAAGDGG